MSLIVVPKYPPLTFLLGDLVTSNTLSCVVFIL